jgi:hypothetical protein
MKPNEVVDEVRKHRDAILEEANGDVWALAEQLRARARIRNATLVTLPPRRVKTTTDVA